MDTDNDNEVRLQRKQAFYAGLATMVDSDDDTPDPGRQASMQAMKTANAMRRSPTAKLRSNNTMGRSASDTQVVQRRRFEAVHRSHTDQQPPSSARAEVAKATEGTMKTFSSIPSKPTNVDVHKVIGKRKRTNDIKLVPDEQQVFKGLKFYFFPNNDTNPARKMRITKALEFGATWQKEFDETVTHVIVDKSLTYEQLLKFLKLSSLPAHVVVASENYPADCISFRSLLNPRQLQFKVKGHIGVQTRPSSSSSDRSLLLKPAGKDVIARQPETQAEQCEASPERFSDDDVQDIDAAPELRHSNKSTVKSIANIQSTEEFDDAVRQARELQDVPLDNDDEPVSRPSSSEGPSTDEGEHSKDRASFPKGKKVPLRWLDKFQCMQKHTGSNTETPNASTIAILQQMATYYEQTGDQWRVRAYRKAVATLRNHPTKIRTREEALALPQIGDRLATKIEEIAFTNRLRRLENARAEPSDQILQTFMRVYGVGYSQASKWVDAGFTTLDELMEKADLTPNQKIGIDHYEDFNSRIPRNEVEQHSNFVKKALQRIDPAFEVITGGSYRRGSKDSSDIDCIITRPDTGAPYIRQVVLGQLVPKLIRKKFFVAELAATSRDEGTKWHGASQLPTSNSNPNRNPWRRIDLLLVPSAEIGAALIYFTGNDIFNRSLRLLAGTKGMRLNQRGLYKDVIRGKGREKLSDGTLVEGKDEKKIFEILGVPWRPPEHRIC